VAVPSLLAAPETDHLAVIRANSWTGVHLNLTPNDPTRAVLLFDSHCDRQEGGTHTRAHTHRHTDVGVSCHHGYFMNVFACRRSMGAGGGGRGGGTANALRSLQKTGGGCKLSVSLKPALSLSLSLSTAVR